MYEQTRKEILCLLSPWRAQIRQAPSRGEPTASAWRQENEQAPSGGVLGHGGRHFS